MKNSTLNKEKMNKGFIIALLFLFAFSLAKSQKNEIEKRCINASKSIEKFLEECGPIPITLREKFEFSMLLFDGITVEKDIGRIPAKSVKPIVEELLSLNPSNCNLNFYMGLCYYYSVSDIEKGIPFFEKATENVTVKYSNYIKQKKAPAWAYYFLAKSYEKTGNYLKSTENFAIFKTFLTPEHKRYHMIVDKCIAFCSKMIKRMELAAKLKNANYVNQETAPFKPQSIPEEVYIEIEEVPLFQDDLRKEYLNRLASLISNPENKEISTHFYNGFPELKQMVISRVNNNKSGTFVLDKDMQNLWIIEK